MDLALGIDLGTSYFKLGLFDREGAIRGLGRVFVPKDAPRPSWCELPTERFWALLNRGLSDACAQAGAQPADIHAMAYSSQANSFVVLDEQGEPLTPLILWPDLRASEIDPRVRELWARADFLDVTGLGINTPEFAVAKLCWFERHEPRTWARMNRVMTISDYLVFCLTGQAVGDGGTTALLGLRNQQDEDWWDDALQLLGLSREQFSAPLRPGAVAGRINADGARRLGLKPGIPLAVGSIDHHVAAIGAGVGHVAPMSESTGTVLACLRTGSQYRPQPGCCVGPDHSEGRWFQLTFNSNGASAVEWYQKQHAPELPIDQLMRLAESAPVGSDGVLALPSPDQRPGLEGFLNRSDHHHHGHFVRAIMESTAATLAALVDSLYPDGRPERIVATGGGARSDLWLQIKADLLGVEFVAAGCEEPACLGAAMLAAAAAGWFPGLADVSAAWCKVGKTFSPASAARPRDV